MVLYLDQGRLRWWGEGKAGLQKSLSELTLSQGSSLSDQQIEIGCIDFFSLIYLFNKHLFNTDCVPNPVLITGYRDEWEILFSPEAVSLVGKSDRETILILCDTY